MNGNVFFQAQTKYFPEVKVDADKSTLEFKGRALPHSLEQMQQIAEWIKLFFEQKHKGIAFIVSLEYSNNVFYRFLNDCFILAKRASKEHEVPIFVVWHHEDDDEEMLADGEDFRDCFPFDFSFVDELLPMNN